MSEENKNGIHRLLSEIQKEVGVVGKDGKNEDQGYTFQRWEDIALEIRQAMNIHGVTMDVSISGPPIRETYQTKNGARAVSTIVPLRITLYAEDGSSVSADWYGESSDYSDKSTGKAVTSGVKGYLLKRFLIPVKPPEGESDDQDGAQHPAAAKNEREYDKRQQAPKNEKPAPAPAASSLNLVIGEEVPKQFWKLTASQKKEALGPDMDTKKQGNTWFVVPKRKPHENR